MYIKLLKKVSKVRIIVLLIYSIQILSYYVVNGTLFIPNIGYIMIDTLQSSSLLTKDDYINVPKNDEIKKDLAWWSWILISLSIVGVSFIIGCIVYYYIHRHTYRDLFAADSSSDSSMRNYAYQRFQNESFGDNNQTSYNDTCPPYENQNNDDVELGAR